MAFSRPQSSLFRPILLPLLLSFISAHRTAGLKVTPGSNCTSVCLGDNDNAASSTTRPSELVCLDSEYQDTVSGTKFEACVECELNSNAYNETTGETDSGWLLYNLRYTIDYCVYGYPNNSKTISSPCTEQCTPFQDQLVTNLLDPDPQTPYAYCKNSTFLNEVDACSSCFALSNADTYIASFLNALKAGCQQQPESGNLLRYSGLFSNSSSSTATSTSSTSTKHLSKSSIIAISVLVPILFLILLATTFCCCRKRIYRLRSARQKRISVLDQRFGDRDITPPTLGGWNAPYIPTRAQPKFPTQYQYPNSGLEKDVSLPLTSTREWDPKLISPDTGSITSGMKPSLVPQQPSPAVTRDNQYKHHIASRAAGVRDSFLAALRQQQKNPNPSSPPALSRSHSHRTKSVGSPVPSESSTSPLTSTDLNTHIDSQSQTPQIHFQPLPPQIAPQSQPHSQSQPRPQSGTGIGINIGIPPDPRPRDPSHSPPRSMAHSRSESKTRTREFHTPEWLDLSKQKHLRVALEPAIKTSGSTPTKNPDDLLFG
ncbi:MAG: hypothetical protein M1834_003571 [Cirrosporium novae-zelandiae]|nr:MAG: hypothetical protein M1834_003571 [Cirrosporium novae-zelandiae]